MLMRVGIGVVHELPGVGENLRDHLHVRISFETKLPVTLNTILRDPLQRAKMGARWLFLGRGLMACSSATSMAIARSRPDLPRPDIKFQLHQLSMASRRASIACCRRLVLLSRHVLIGSKRIVGQWQVLAGLRTSAIFCTRPRGFIQSDIDRMSGSAGYAIARASES